MSLPIRTHTFSFDPDEHQLSNDNETCFNCGVEVHETHDLDRIDKRYETPISGTIYCRACFFFEDYTMTGAQIMALKEGK